MSKNRLKFILCVTLLSLCFLRGDARSVVDSTKSKRKILAFPILFYLPETSWGFGATGISNFRLSSNSDLDRPSQVQLGIVYTLNKQWLFLIPFNLYLDRDRYNLSGELAYYKFLYNFYGIGEQSLLDDLEKYSVNYPRIRINALRRFGNSFWIGLKYGFDALDFEGFDSDGQLVQGNTFGTEGGNYSALSLAGEWDSRDNIFYPRKGIRAQWEYRVVNSMLGSDFDFRRINLDVSSYFQLKENHILVLNALGGFSSKEVPFFYLNNIGNAKNARGYNDRRFMDRQFMTLQAEYRIILKKHFGIVLFTSLSKLSHDFDDLAQAKNFAGYGVGLRYCIDKKDMLNIRTDFAFTPEGFNFYFTIGEAF